MKSLLSRFRLRKPDSFTLVELLVVIAIIAILASVILGISGVVINAAKRARAQNTAQQIQTSCLAYYTEYSVYPNPTPGTAGDSIITDVTANKTVWGNLIETLCGNIKPSTGLAATQTTITNSRSIAFLSMKASDVDVNDAPLNPLNGTPGLTNLYFNIAIDTDYDGILGATPSAVAGMMPNFTKSTTTSMDYTGTSTAGVAVWENCNPNNATTNPNFWVHTY
jgi:prepilin-type N-terminal cleavage/methylation domain-containing protein